MEIAGKVFIVTGGASGLGEGTARMLAAHGATVVVADMQHYSRFVLETLLKHPSVQDCRTSFVLDWVKRTTALPV